MTQSNVHIIITKTEKNPVLGAILGFFFGPIGLLYSTVSGALVMFVASVISGLLIPFMIGIPMIICCWIASAAWGYLACDKSNKQIAQSVVHSSEQKAA